MVPVEQHQQRAHGRGEQEQPVLRKDVGVEQPAPVEHADLLLRVLVVAVQRREVDVRRRVVDADVLVRRAEDAGRLRQQAVRAGQRDLRVDDERREREEHARQPSGVRLKLHVSHEHELLMIMRRRGRLLTFSRLRSVSKTSPGSGSSFAGSGWDCCTLREYGLPALPRAGSVMLLYDPSALRKQ